MQNKTLDHFRKKQLQIFYDYFLIRYLFHSTSHILHCSKYPLIVFYYQR